MAKNKNKNNTQNDDNNNNEQNETKNNKKEEKKDQTTPTSIVLKVDMHCDGCASKIIRFIRGFQGVDKVKVMENEAGKLTISGNVDPAKLRDKLATKMKKKVEVISPILKNEKENKSQNENKNKKSQNDDKKLKEPPVTTAVLKVEMHCQGCIEKIRTTVSKAKGVYHVTIDKEKETVTVKGTMDVKVLVEKLTKRFKRKVEVVPTKKEKENDKKDGDKVENDGGKKNKQKGESGGGNNKVENNGDGKGKMEIFTPANGYGYGYGGYGFLGFDEGYNYGQAQMMQFNAPQIFSDENPNACSVM